MTDPIVQVSVSAAGPLSDPTPSLTIDVAEPILTLAIRQAALTSVWDTASVAQPLNVLPRSTSPLLTKVALTHLPHMGLDAATKLNDVPLLRFMLAWSKQPGGPPVRYTLPMLFCFERGHTDALNWWIDESGLSFLWDMLAVGAACHAGHVNVLDWWARRGFPSCPDSPEATEMMVASGYMQATRGARVDVLEWLMEHVPDAQKRAEEALDQQQFLLQYAAESGNAEVVLDWWMEMAKRVGKTLVLEPVVKPPWEPAMEQTLEAELEPAVVEVE